MDSFYDDLIMNELSYNDNDLIIKNNKSLSCDCGDEFEIIDGQYVCQGCGEMKIEHKIDNSFQVEYDRNGAPVSKDGGFKANPLLPQSSMNLRMNHRRHKFNSGIYHEMSLLKVFNNMKILCGGVLQKNILDDAHWIISRIFGKRYDLGKRVGKRVIVRGTNRVKIIIAALKYACIKNGNSRNSKEIAKMCRMTEKDINDGVKKLMRLFDQIEKEKIPKNMGLTNISHFVGRKCEELDLELCYTRFCVKISTNIDKLKLYCNHTTYSFAAACIMYIINLFNIKICKKIVANLFGISIVTLDKTIIELHNFKYLLFCDAIYIDHIYDNINRSVVTYKDNRFNLDDKIIVSKILYDMFTFFGINNDKYLPESFVNYYNRIMYYNEFIIYFFTHVYKYDEVYDFDSVIFDQIFIIMNKINHMMNDMIMYVKNT